MRLLKLRNGDSVSPRLRFPDRALVDACKPRKHLRAVALPCVPKANANPKQHLRVVRETTMPVHEHTLQAARDHGRSAGSGQWIGIVRRRQARPGTRLLVLACLMLLCLSARAPRHGQALDDLPPLCALCGGSVEASPWSPWGVGV